MALPRTQRWLELVGARPRRIRFLRHARPLAGACNAGRCRLRACWLFKGAREDDCLLPGCKLYGQSSLSVAPANRHSPKRTRGGEATVLSTCLLMVSCTSEWVGLPHTA